MRVLAVVVMMLFFSASARAETYVAISFHDVRDDEESLGPDDITTASLVGFFDWLVGNGWSAVSLDDIEAAHSGKKKLPPKAILLTFDDGYASHYSRVYPLLRAYGFPAVFFLVGSWMEGGPDGIVRYGDKDLPRGDFLSWSQVREMAASGLAEFGSHSHDLHQGIAGNPQGSKPPAAATWSYDPASGQYEADAVLQARIHADLKRSIETMQREVGRVPRALAWPFGRTSGPAMVAARQAGFRYVMGLAHEPADTARPMQIQRLYPTQNPSLKEIVALLRPDTSAPEQLRLACLGLDDIAATDPESALGQAIEDIRRLGPGTVLLDPFAAADKGLPLRSPWFRSGLVPARKDFLGFAAWQIRSRAGVEVFLRLDLHAIAAAAGTEHVAELVRDIVRAAPVDGIVIDPPGPFLAAGPVPVPAKPWTMRVARERIAAMAAGTQDDRLVLQAWEAARQERPDLRLGIMASLPLAGAWPASGADFVLLKPDGARPAGIIQSLTSQERLDPAAGSRLVLPLTGDPVAAAEDLRRAQARGAAAFAYCPAKALPADPAMRAAFSISRFPRLP